MHSARSHSILPRLALLTIVTGAGAWAIASQQETPEKVPAFRPEVEKLAIADRWKLAAKEMKPYREELAGTDVGFDMVVIPGGSFLMGSPEEEEGRQDSEGPQREVAIEPFWMGKCEVTWDEYDLWSLSLEKEGRGELQTDYEEAADAVARPTPRYTDMTFGMGQNGYPVICMTQFNVRKYCQWLSAKTGHHYRLPTEAEWEYACRAGSTTAYSFGDDMDELLEYAWLDDNAEESYHAVGQKKPNAWGLHDMHGNVAEWCLDKFLEQYPPGDPEGALWMPFAKPDAEYPRVVRGGSWKDWPEDLRSAARRGSERAWKQKDPQLPKSVWYHTDAQFLGFRVVRPFNEKPERFLLEEPEDIDR